MPTMTGKSNYLAILWCARLAMYSRWKRQAKALRLAQLRRMTIDGTDFEGFVMDAALEVEMDVEAAEIEGHITRPATWEQVDWEELKRCK